jgi:hypothetical protein
MVNQAPMPHAYLTPAELEQLYRSMDRAERLQERRAATPAPERRPRPPKPASGRASARETGKEGR